MKIYHFDNAGIYINATDARPSPLEPGNFLVPAKATTVTPPPGQSGHVRVFSGGVWVQVVDNKGIYYDANRKAVAITGIGETIPDGWTLAPRPLTPEEIAQEEAKNAALAALAARIAEIELAQEGAGLKQYTVQQGTDWITNKLTNAPNTVVGVKQAVGEILIKMLPYIFPK